MNQATAEFKAIASKASDDLLSFDPVAATYLGNHDHDHRLPDMSAGGRAQQRQSMADHLSALDAVDDFELSLADQTDLEILRGRLTRSQFEVGELRAATWNPMVWNPGTALHLLVSREFAPAAERAASARGRLAEIPRFLADARVELEAMTEIHSQTAITQLQGAIGLIQGQIAPMVKDDTVVAKGIEAIRGFSNWVEEQLPQARRSPRLGERMYSANLWHCLEEGTSAHHLLSAAEEHLNEVTSAMGECAGEYLGEKGAAPDLIRRALVQIADQAPVTNLTILPIIEQALGRTTEFVREHDIVSIPDVDVRVIQMPEIHRGVAVAYCDAPGPLEAADIATYVAVAPTPADWANDRITSFYREYNAVQAHGLTIHEAMPGHVLQLAHAKQMQASTDIRRITRSGVFIEGWAVYVEELMVDAGYAGNDGSALALRLQQLKMQARMSINAILDVRVHTMEMSESEAMDLMIRRGFQEVGEAAGKWRRALLTAGQLPTYFVGYQGMKGIVSDLGFLHPEWSQRRLHDLVLSYGCPSPRYLRSFLGI